MFGEKVKGGGIMAKGDSYHDVPGYIRHWISDSPEGHKIIILTETGKMEFNCKWSDRKRGTSGRVIEQQNYENTGEPGIKLKK